MIILLFLTVTSILFSIPAVQTKIAKVATSYVNKDFKTDINIEKIDLSALGQIKLKGVLINDHKGDTLIYANQLKASALSYQNFLKSKLQFNQLFLNDFKLKMKTYANEKEDNLTIFINKFDTKTESSSDFLFQVSQMIVENGSFYIIDENSKSTTFFTEIEGKLTNFEVNNSDVSTEISSLKLLENNRINITEFSSRFSYTNRAISLSETSLKTQNNTFLKGNVLFEATSNGYANFVKNVPLKAKLKGKIALRDMNLFYNEFGKKGKLQFYSEIKGPLENITLKNLQIKDGRSANIRGNIDIKNMLNEQLSLNASIEKATLSVNFLNKILPNLAQKNIPKNVKEWGKFVISGTTFIKGNNIKTNSLLENDEIGKADINLQIKNFNKTDNAFYKGTVKLKDFNIGKIANDSLLGSLTTSIDVQGKGFTKESLKVSTHGKIKQLEYNGYSYSNISLNGLIKNKRFDGSMEVNDPNIKLNFKGLVDFSSSLYVADFKSIIDYSDLNKLKVFTRDSVANLKGEVMLKAKGSSLDDVVGSINFGNLSFVNHKDTYFFKDFTITSAFKDSIRTIDINSPEIISGNIKGQFKFDELGKLAKNAFASIYANFQPIEVSSSQYVDFQFRIYNKVIEVLYPDVELAANTLIRGNIVADDNKFKLSVKSPQVTVYKNKIKKLNIQVDNKNPLFNAQVSIDSINTNYYDISKFKLVNVTLNDTLFFTSEFQGGKKSTEKYDFSFYHTLTENDESVFGIFNSMAKIKETPWLFNEKNNRKNKIVYNRKTNQYKIEDIVISSKNQKVNIFGEGSSLSDHINFDFKNVNLSKIIPDIESLKVDGIVNGAITYVKQNKQIKPQANFTIDNFKLNDIEQGNAHVMVVGENPTNYNVDISLRKPEEEPSFTTKGTLNFDQKEPTANLDVEFLAFNIKPFNSLTDDVFNKLRGDAYGTLKISENIKNPNIEGDLYLDQAGLYIPLLNVDYDLKGTSVINFKKQKITFADVVLQDTQQKTEGDFTGNITHKSFEKWKLDLGVSTKNLLVLNTEEQENSLYYGVGFLDGNASLKGFLDNLTISVNGKTKKGTHFVIPVNDVKTAESSDLIQFINKKEEENYLTKRWKLLSKKLDGVSLNFNLELTKDAEFEMVIDKISGSYLKGSGTGNVQIELDTKDKFEMYGYFVIDKGIYDFKYGIISKPFSVKKGGIIKFNGDPFAAEIDLDAVHKVSANPRTILENVTTTKKIPVNLITRFSGELFNTKRNFDIEFPNLSPTLASELEFKIQNNVTQQFISLLVLNSFFYTGGGGLSGNSIIYGTGADVLSNAFESILNSGYKNFSLKPVYTVGDKTNIEGVDVEDQLGLVLDYQISDRIIVNGKFGVPIGSRERSNVIGEGNIDFLLNNEGNIKLSLFNRQNEIQYTEEEQGYTQGIGINYQIDFDTGKELLEKIGVLKRKDTVKNKLNDSLKVKRIEKLRKFKARKKDTINQ